MKEMGIENTMASLAYRFSRSLSSFFFLFSSLSGFTRHSGLAGNNLDFVCRHGVRVEPECRI
jgi:hypothetical protein